MVMDSRAFRDALGCFATGITIITAKALDGEVVGFTANSFNAVSLDPPLILFSLGRRAHSLPTFLTTEYFAVNVLREGQEELSNRFAKPLSDKWAGVAFDTWDAGCPILRDALANFECKTRYTHEGGDHVIFVGEVVRMAADREGSPLLYYRGAYRSIGAAT